MLSTQHSTPDPHLSGAAETRFVKGHVRKKCHHLQQNSDGFSQNIFRFFSKKIMTCQEL